MRARAVLNPRAGLRARRARAALQSTLMPWDVEITETTGPGHAVELARESAQRGDAAVLAVGGDGTANEVAAGLLGSETALGLVPMGSGNGLARTLGLPLRPEAALRALATSVVRRMDIGTANGRPFINVAGAGFDAAVGLAFHEHGRRGGRRGIFTYVRMGLRAMLSYRAQVLRLDVGGECFEGPALLVTFANGRQYGAEAVIAAGARLDDGLLDVVVLEDAAVWELLLHAPRLFLGGLDRFQRYRRFAATQAVLTSAQPVAFHRDGEPDAPESRVEIGILPRALRMLVPAHTAEDPRGPFSNAPETIPPHPPLPPRPTTS
jgi:diacylglycerol kinase (ATP)